MPWSWGLLLVRSPPRLSHLHSFSDTLTFPRRQHIRETLAGICGEYIVTAPGPDHSVEGARYGDSFRAFVVTSKCADAIPLIARPSR